MIIYLFWISIGLYVGVGGYIALDLEERKKQAMYLPENKVDYGGVSFRNSEMMNVYDDEKKAKEYFDFILKSLPKNMIYLFTAMAFGILGVITRITKEIAIDKVEIMNVEIYFFPILGLMTGILILAISQIIPNILISGNVSVEPLTLAFLSLIAGFCSRQFYNWLINTSGSIFPKKTK